MTQSSFYWAMRLLPRHKRHAMFTLYGLCRRLDDIADSVGLAQDKLHALTQIRNGLDKSADVALLTRYGVPLTELHMLCDGVESDVSNPPYAPSLDDLRLYCRRVAGTVGIATIHILGRPDAEALALILGEALQLTNIARDVDEDLANGRLYLPQPYLAQSGWKGDGLTAAILSQARRLTAELAQCRFQEARQELSRIGSSRLWPALAMASIYQAQLSSILKAAGTQAPRRPGTMTTLLLTLRSLACR